MMSRPKRSKNLHNQSSSSSDSESDNVTEQINPTVGQRSSSRIRLNSSAPFIVTVNPMDDEKGVLSDYTNTLQAIITKEKLVKQAGFVLCDPEDDAIKENLKTFKGIDQNIYTTVLCYDKKYDGMKCECIITKAQFDAGVIGCEDFCQNRLTLFECGPSCKLGSRCHNKLFQDKIYTPMKLFKTSQKGYGLQTLVRVQQGGFLIEYVGEIIDQDEFNLRCEKYGGQDPYFLKHQTWIIDAKKYGNSSRYINHSCSPNCAFESVCVNGIPRLGLFAKRDLEVYEEITYDYKAEGFGNFNQICLCNAPDCRGQIWKHKDTEEKNPQDPQN